MTAFLTKTQNTLILFFQVLFNWQKIANFALVSAHGGAIESRPSSSRQNPNFNPRHVDPRVFFRNRNSRQVGVVLAIFLDMEAWISAFHLTLCQMKYSYLHCADVPTHKQEAFNTRGHVKASMFAFGITSSDALNSSTSFFLAPSKVIGRNLVVTATNVISRCKQQHPPRVARVVALCHGQVQISSGR